MFWIEYALVEEPLTPHGQSLSETVVPFGLLCCSINCWILWSAFVSNGCKTKFLCATLCSLICPHPEKKAYSHRLVILSRQI